MKAYKGSFRKKNGETRDMIFARIDDLPESFLDQKITGSGAEKNYPAGMELVWDLEADAFRIFNHSAAQTPIKEFSIDPSYFD
jgi:hypothetical protein